MLWMETRSSAIKLWVHLKWLSPRFDLNECVLIQDPDYKSGVIDRYTTWALKMARIAGSAPANLSVVH